MRTKDRLCVGTSMAARVAALVAALFLTVGLCACSAQKEAPEDVAVIKLDVQKPFEGHEARDGSELGELLDQALDLGQMRKDTVESDAEEAQLTKKVNKDFKTANEDYKEGDYATARELYEGILDTYPLHYGANVNLTLALLQMEENESALIQALACCHLYPKECMLLLNVQTAGTACGFSTEDLESAMSEVLAQAGGDLEELKLALGGENSGLYAYNRIWDSIETELYQEAQRQASQDQEDADQQSADVQVGDAAEDSSVEDGIVETGLAYEELDSALSSLEEGMPEDVDVPALHAYLYAVGLQLGLNADASAMSPVHTMPFIAVYDELCKIEAKELVYQDGYWEMTFELTNKTVKTDLMIREVSPWLLDGADVEVELEAQVVEPGQTQEFRIWFMADSTNLSEDEAEESKPTEVLGVLQLKDAAGNNLRAYPVSWKAAQE